MLNFISKLIFYNSYNSLYKHPYSKYLDNKFIPILNDLNSLSIGNDSIYGTFGSSGHFIIWNENKYYSWLSSGVIISDDGSIISWGLLSNLYTSILEAELTKSFNGNRLLMKKIDYIPSKEVAFKLKKLFDNFSKKFKYKKPKDGFYIKKIYDYREERRNSIINKLIK